MIPYIPSAATNVTELALSGHHESRVEYSWAFIGLLVVVIVGVVIIGHYIQQARNEDIAEAVVRRMAQEKGEKQ